MNNMTEVWELIDDFHTNTTLKVKQAMNTIPNKQWREMNGEAAKMAREYEKRLSRLKLTPNDRQHLSLLRKMFNECIKCFDSNCKGNQIKAIKASEKAVAAINEYMARKNIRPK